MKKAVSTEAREQRSQHLREKVQPLAALARTSHGVKALAVCKPERWPEPLRTLYRDRCAELAAMPHLADVRFTGVIRQVAYLELLAGAARQWIATRGLTDAAGKPIGLTAFALSLENSLSRAYQVAGLTPHASARYIVQPESLMAALAGVQEAEMEPGREGANGNAETHD